MPHVRKSKLVEERLKTYADFLVADPSSLRGLWRRRFGRPDARLHVDLGCGKRPDARLHVDLGCGKGLWISRAAQALPGDAFVGIDNDRTCVSFALERIGSARAGNALVVFDEARSLRELFAPGEIDVLHVNFPTPFPRKKEAASRVSARAGNALVVFDEARSLRELFAPGEIDVLHVNFPTPFPRKKEAASRVTSSARLMEYRDLLAPDGRIQLKTDSQPLFDFTLEQLDRTGYEVVQMTRDMRGGGFAASCEDLVPSAYEEKLVAKGARVLALHAAVGARPVDFIPEDLVGLAQYLPEDLDALDYAPHGMEDTVANLRNRKRNAAAKEERLAGRR